MTFLYLLPIYLFGLFGSPYHNPAPVAPAHVVSFYDFTVNNLYGEPINFMRFKGKKVLLVNVASKCGYTPQYKDLQALHKQYGEKVVVIGFPSNDFGGQEPLEGEAIADFCQKNYGVDFLIMEKISVKGPNAHPLYQWLADPHLNGWNKEAPSWNFCKYLIDENGKLVKFWPSKVDPMGKEVVAAVNS